MSDVNRKNLAAAQAKLVAALTAAEPPPQGFDGDRVRLTARTLLTKRRAAIAKSWPALAESLGDKFAAKFLNYAHSQPMPPEGHSADARALAEHLLARRELPDAGCIALLLDRARSGGRLRWMRLPGQRRWALAIRIASRVRWCVLPM